MNKNYTEVVIAGKTYNIGGYEDPEYLHSAPHSCPIGRPDETAAARNPILKYEFNDQ